MRHALLVGLIIFILAAITADLITQDPGYLLIEYKNWVLETSLAAVAILGLSLFLILLLLFKLLQMILRPVQRLRIWFGQRKQKETPDAKQAR